MSLNPITDPALLDVLAELVKREPIFHRPEFGTTIRHQTASGWKIVFHHGTIVESL